MISLKEPSPQFSKPNNVVNITIPASFSYKLDALEKIQRDVLGRLGCPNCHSGFDLRFQIERRFVYNNKAEHIGY